jgi:hypothetical protein
MRTATAVTVALLLEAAQVPVPDVRLVKSDGERLHTYAIHTRKGVGRKASRLTLALRGPQPLSVRAPSGWVAEIRSADISSLWGCTWQVELSPSRSGGTARLPILDLQVLFGEQAPRSWCWCQLESESGIVSFGGPDAVTIGVSSRAGGRTSAWS